MHGGAGALCVGQRNGDVAGEGHEVLLGLGVCLSLAVMRVVDPPDDGEEDGPGGADEVIDEVHVRKVERPPRVFLRYA